MDEDKFKDSLKEKIGLDNKTDKPVKKLVIKDGQIDLQKMVEEEVKDMPTSFKIDIRRRNNAALEASKNARTPSKTANNRLTRDQLIYRKNKNNNPEIVIDDDETPELDDDDETSENISTKSTNDESLEDVSIDNSESSIVEGLSVTSASAVGDTIAGVATSAEASAASVEADAKAEVSAVVKDQIKKKIKKAILALLRNPWFWIILIVLIILIIIILWILLFLYNPTSSVESILCGGDSKFDDLKVITTSQKMTKENGKRKYLEPLDSWEFYDYVKAVVSNELAIDSDPTHASAYQAQAIAAASYAIDRGGYYSRMSENQAQYQSWCGANQEWVTVNGVKTFKCPGWSKESEIIILANSTDCQTACDIYNGCYIYVGSTKTNSSGTTVNDGDEDGFTDGDNGDTDGRIDTTDTSGSKGCKVDVYKSMVDGYNAPATWTKTCSNGLTAVATKKTREALSKDKQSQYEEMIEKVKGIFLTDANGKISYGSYGAAGTPGCSKTPGESMAMCHAKRGYDDITTQSASGWSALRILNFWYKDAYLATKSASGTAMCEMYTPELTDGTSKLNWTDNNGSNHVADNNFDFETFLTKDNSTGTGSSIANYNALIKSVATSYGLGKRLSVVNVGTIYVSMLASMGVRGSYHFGGKYDKYGINPDTGKPANAKVEGTMSNVPKSFDCTGFFYWALKNAGLNTPPNLLAKTAEDSNYFDILDDNHKVIGVVGDALYHRNNGSTVHARLVIGHDVSKEGIITSNITIESAGGRGMIIDRYSIIDAETSGGQPFGIINLQRCYDGGSVNGASCSIVNEDDFFKGVDTGETISE